jgi:hypothetical protein
MFGNRQFPNGRDFLSGRFELFDGSGRVLYDTGPVTPPAPNRDATLTLLPSAATMKQIRARRRDHPALGQGGRDRRRGSCRHTQSVV